MGLGVWVMRFFRWGEIGDDVQDCYENRESSCWSASRETYISVCSAGVYGGLGSNSRPPGLPTRGTKPTGKDAIGLGGSLLIFRLFFRSVLSFLFLISLSRLGVGDIVLAKSLAELDVSLRLLRAYELQRRLRGTNTACSCVYYFFFCDILIGGRIEN